MEKTQNILLLDLVGTGFEYDWNEVPKLSNIAKESTVTRLAGSNKNILKREFNWSNLYGELTRGEYRFVIESSSIAMSVIEVEFTIHEDGNITYSEPSFI